MSSIFYPYRIFLSSGHSFQVYRPEEDEVKILEAVRNLNHTVKPFSYFYFDKDGSIISGAVFADEIIGVDRPFGIKPVDLEERKKIMEEARLKASKPNDKVRVGSTAIDITQRK